MSADEIATRVAVRSTTMPFTNNGSGTSAVLSTRDGGEVDPQDGGRWPCGRRTGCPSRRARRRACWPQRQTRSDDSREGGQGQRIPAAGRIGQDEDRPDFTDAHDHDELILARRREDGHVRRGGHRYVDRAQVSVEHAEQAHPTRPRPREIPSMVHGTDRSAAARRKIELANDTAQTAAGRADLEHRVAAAREQAWLSRRPMTARQGASTTIRLAPGRFTNCSEESRTISAPSPQSHARRFPPPKALPPLRRR